MLSIQPTALLSYVEHLMLFRLSQVSCSCSFPTCQFACKMILWGRTSNGQHHRLLETKAMDNPKKGSVHLLHYRLQPSVSSQSKLLSYVHNLHPGLLVHSAIIVQMDTD